MSTTDGALNPPYATTTTKHDSTSIPEINTAPSSPRRSIRTSPKSTRSSPNSCSISEQHRRHRSDGRRQKSIASSSENSRKSPGNGHGSKPSSRRTSCTMVDPSRPARHYRIASSPSVPTANRDIDDVIALHFRSCSLFHNPQPQTTSPDRANSNHQTASVDISPKQMENSPTLTAHSNANGSSSSITKVPAKSSDEELVPPQNNNTTMHWLSPETRREQYERMDKANTGLRCLVRRVVPKTISGTPPPRFFDDGRSDVGSVRRYRMDLPEEEEITMDEKSAPLSLRRAKEGAEVTTTECDARMRKKRRWLCF